MPTMIKNPRVREALERRIDREEIQPELEKQEKNRTNLYLFLLALVELIHILTPLLLNFLPILQEWIEAVISWL